MQPRARSWWKASLGAALGLGLAGPALAGGLVLPADGSPWPRWQARLGLSTELAPSPSERYALSAGAPAGASRLLGGSVLGDYYFRYAAPEREASGGFRATSGLLFGSGGLVAGGLAAVQPRVASRLSLGLAGSAADVLPGARDPDAGAKPYLGVGYSSVDLRGGWGFSADVGLLALNPGSVRLGRALGSPQGLEDTLREMRLSPVLQLGVNYAF